MRRNNPEHRAWMLAGGVLLAAVTGILIGGALAAITVTALWGPQSLWMLRRG